MTSDPQTASARAYDAVRSSMRTGEAPVGSHLDEARLVRDLVASRTAVRAALARLSAEGLVERRQRRGTTVLREPIRVSSRRLGTGGSPAPRLVPELVEDETLTPSDVLAGRIATPSGLARLRVHVLLDSGERIGVRMLNHDAAARTQSLSDIDGSAADDFRAAFSIALSHVETIIEAQGCDERTAALIGVAPGSPVLRREQILVGVDGVPRLLSTTRFRGDRASFLATETTPTSPAP